MTAQRPTASTITDTQLEQLYAELDALKSIGRGYCPHCGRGDCSPTADQWYEQKQRAERAEALLRRYVQLADVTHNYPIQGGHDCLGKNLTCAGCALRDEIRVALARTALDEHQEQP